MRSTQELIFNFITYRQLYGVNPQVNPSVLAIDDIQVAYVCGHNVVIYNTENKQYRFIQGEFVF